MNAALARERDSELHRALDAVVDIAKDRLQHLDQPEAADG
jgi:2-oxo-4-hydroxy-4-carboxy--5-ureidoimidazoline (OHCU) decarboxylase